MKGRFKEITAALALALMPLSPASAGDSFVGRVTAVKGANVITMQQGTIVYDVRINGIVVDQDPTLARAARDAVSQMVLGKNVRLRFDGLYDGQMTGRIKIGAIGKPEEQVRDLGVELVRDGLVRRDTAYAKYKYGQMEQAESEARQNRRGLWR
jgi:endonuclease YncB( thermonuclease family)